MSLDSTLVSTEAPVDPSMPLIQMRGVQKRFPGVLALDGIDFELRPGEVHVLFGENGAGKSTLINLISGTFPADGGTYTYCGETLNHLTPHHARQIGISPVFQEFSLAPDLTVQENLFLGREITAAGMLKKRQMRARAREVLDQLDFDLNPDARVGTLSRAQQQMTEIAKALLQEVKVLILDEPTASLSEHETDTLFDIVATLQAQGVGIIYVSHRMAEIKRIANRVTVLRDGRLIGTVEAASVTEDKLVEMMTGRTFDALFPQIAYTPGPVLLETRDLTTAGREVIDADLKVRAGEVVGIAGLVGCGKSELARAIYGLHEIVSGEVLIDDKPRSDLSPASMLRSGVCYFPSDRVGEGLSLSRPIRENMSLAALDLDLFARNGILKRQAERDKAQEMSSRLRVNPPDIERRVEFLSGGNRQKVMLARGLTRDIRVYLFDEPTVGIDVGAKTEVYDLIKELVEGGAAVVVISSELPEVIHMSHRVYVMHRGYLVAELDGDDINEAEVLSYFFDKDHEADTEGHAP